MPSTSSTRRRSVLDTLLHYTDSSRCPAKTSANNNSPCQQDDELPEPYLKGFEYDTDTEESKLRLLVHLTSTPEVAQSGGSKKKKGKKDE